MLVTDDNLLQSLPDIDIAVPGDRTAFLDRIARLGENSGFSIERRDLTLGGEEWVAINLRAPDSGAHNGLGFQLISRSDRPGRVLIEVRAARWHDGHPTRQAYIDAARTLVCPLLRAYNRDQGARFRLRIACDRLSFRISARTEGLIDRFGVLANTRSLHPLDWGRFYAIVREGKQQIPGGLLRTRLMSYGFAPKTVDRLVELHEHLWAYKRRRWS